MEDGRAVVDLQQKKDIIKWKSLFLHFNFIFILIILMACNEIFYSKQFLHLNQIYDKRFWFIENKMMKKRMVSKQKEKDIYSNVVKFNRTRTLTPGRKELCRTFCYVLFCSILVVLPARIFSYTQLNLASWFLKWIVMMTTILFFSLSLVYSQQQSKDMCFYKTWRQLFKMISFFY